MSTGKSSPRGRKPAKAAKKGRKRVNLEAMTSDQLWDLFSLVREVLTARAQEKYRALLDMEKKLAKGQRKLACKPHGNE